MAAKPDRLPAAQLLRGLSISLEPGGSEVLRFYVVRFACRQ